MIRGFMKTTSLTALVAAAGMLMGNSVYAPANAADLGGGCCADLEERVAELEATTVRKGNRVVSVQLYGQVNRALMYWDDGVDEDVYVVDNDMSSSRIGLTGTGQLKPGYIAGFRAEWNIQEADVSAVNQIEHDTNDSGQPVAWDIRQAHVYLESDRLGRVSLGQLSQATDGIVEINLGGSSGKLADGLWGAGFSVRDAAPADDLDADADATPPVFANVTWGDLLFNEDGGRTNSIRYDTPSIFGFILSASWGEDDSYDVALRYSKEWNSIRFAAGIGYRVDEADSKALDADPANDDDAVDKESLLGSASIMHVPTGLFAHVQAGNTDYEFNDSATFPDGEREFWYVQAGISKNWFGYGATTIYGDYGENELSNIAGLGYRIEGTSRIEDADTTQWGFGINQAFDSAATDIYLHYVHYELDHLTAETATPTEDFDAVVGGMRVKF